MSKIDHEKRETENFNGAYGFVILPDKETETFAINLAKELAPKAEFQVQAPHITLYHAKFENLPEEIVKEKLIQLKAYEGISFTLNNLVVYGGKFLFWNVQEKGKLRLAHQKSLETATFLDRAQVANAIEEGLNLNSEELENIKKYGHPLVRGNYLPHITLAYDGRGIRIPSGITEKPWKMKIEKIHFAEMGTYGSVKRIIF